MLQPVAAPLHVQKVLLFIGLMPFRGKLRGVQGALCANIGNDLSKCNSRTKTYGLIREYSLGNHWDSQAIGIREHQFEAEMLEKHYLQIRIAWLEVGVQENRLGNH